MKGDRFIKDRQHVHFIYDGVKLISKAAKGQEKGHKHGYRASLIHKTLVLYC